MVTNVTAFVPGMTSSITTLDSLTQQRRAAVQAVATLSSSDILGANQEVALSVDPATRQIVIRILDSQTKEVLRQFPAEQLLQVAAALGGSAATSPAQSSTAVYA